MPDLRLLTKAQLEAASPFALGLLMNDLTDVLKKKEGSWKTFELFTVSLGSEK